MALGDKITFNYTGAVQTYTVPAGVTRLKLEAWGAEGGQRTANRSTTVISGGRGGYAKGLLNVTPGQVLNIYVGGKGADISSADNSWGGAAGGYNGGGQGGASSTSSYNYQGGAGGGGASDIRLGGTALANRIIVGAGGGGGGGNAGGYAGGLDGRKGGDGVSANNGGGGTQTAGGTVNSGSYTGASGSLGTGGYGGGGNISNGAGGGGAGYYGGAGGTDAGGGGGGSSYYGTLAEPLTTSDVQQGNGLVVLTIDANNPAISPTSQDLGYKDSKDGTVTYTASCDTASGVTMLSIVEKLNGSVIRTLTNPSQLTQTINLDKMTWDNLIYADRVQTLTVEANDSVGRTVTTQYTFRKRLASTSDSPTIIKGIKDLETYIGDKKTRIKNILTSNGETLTGSENLNQLLDLEALYKYKPGSNIPFYNLVPSTPPRVLSQAGDATYNQQIHTKYASAETGNSFIPVYTTGPDPIYMYDQEGNNLGSFSFNRSVYGTIYAMLEYNGYLYVFSSAYVTMFNIATKAIVNAGNSIGYKMVGGRLIKRANKVYYSSANGQIAEFNLDTFALVRTITVDFMYLQAMDDNDNFYGNASGGKDLVKYNSAGSLIYQSSAAVWGMNYNYRNAEFSKARQSIFIATYNSAGSRVYLEEFRLSDGAAIGIIDLYAVTGTSAVESNMPGICSGMIMVQVSGIMMFFNEKDLSYIKKLGLLYNLSTTFYVNDRYLVGETYSGSWSIITYALTTRLK